ncbi:hypothetical protein M8J77_014983 [Diaphorina citri]|nr:hypothetical protein M8J77_014983 [Diaphorina citri]
MYSVSTPVPKEFKCKDNTYMKYHIFHFHSYFQCLIGMDVLEKLGFSIDLNRKVLRNNQVEIPLRYRDSNPEFNLITIPPHTEEILQIPIETHLTGDIVIPRTQLGDKQLFIPEGVTSVSQDKKIICSLVNPSDTEYKVRLMRPLRINTSHFDEVKPCELNLTTTEENKIDTSRFNLKHLNAEELYEIKKIINQYSDVFHTEGQPLTFANEVKHVINTTDEVPIHAKSYRYPEVHKAEVQRQIQKMLDDNIIRPSHSPWCSPIWVVPKKLDNSGQRKWRIVVDYRKLNEKTIGDKYPLPNIDDLLDKLGRCNYFSTLDLASGFYQIEMDPGSIQKTAFNALGHWEYLRLPMGLSNSPSTFQRTMDNVLRGLIGTKCVVYMDDILVYSTSLQEHIVNLKAVLDRLRSFNLKIQIDKTNFLCKEVAFLGHLVTPSGVKPNPDKINAVKNYPIPKNTKQLKGFLGLLGYYRKFIKNFAGLTKPLTMRLKKDAVINVKDQDYVECFEICKNLLINDPILQYPDFTQKFILTTDASNVAIGAVLSQGTIGKDLPVAYASRTLNEHEQNYSTIERELLAIVWATRYFRPYLYGRRFTIVTDHRPLAWVFSLKDPSSKLVRWRLKLEEYEYDVVYKKGTSNTNADALSRIELNVIESDEISSMLAEPDTDTNQLFDLDTFVRERIENEIFPDEFDTGPILTSNIPSVTNTPVRNTHTSAQNNLPTQPQDIVTSTSLNIPTQNLISPNIPQSIEPIINADTELTTQTFDNDNNDDSHTVHTCQENPIVGIPISEGAINSAFNQIIVMSTSSHKFEFERTFLHANKQRITVKIPQINAEDEILQFIKTYVAPKIKYHLYFVDDLYAQFSRVLQAHFTSSAINFLKCTKFLKDIENEETKDRIIKSIHEGKTNHRGIDEVTKEIKEIYYWPNIQKYVQDFVNSCEICLTTKYERRPFKLQYNLTPTTRKPFETVHVDTVALDKTKFLTIVDPFSKFAQAYALKSCQAVEIADKLLESFSHHGLPTNIISDNGGEFKNAVIKEFLSLHKINIHFVSSQHPESNSPVERFHSTLIEHIRLFKNRPEFKGSSISHLVKYALIAYNNSIHSATNMRPIEIITGHMNPNPVLELDNEVQITRDYVNSHREKVNQLYDQIHTRLAKEKETRIGKVNENREKLPPDIPSEVFVKNKQKQNKTGNKYKKETIAIVHTDRKTAEIVKQHANTSEGIHLSNIRRPTVPKNFPSRPFVSGSESSSSSSHSS